MENDNKPYIVSEPSPADLRPTPEQRAEVDELLRQYKRDQETDRDWVVGKPRPY